MKFHKAQSCKNCCNLVHWKQQKPFCFLFLQNAIVQFLAWFRVAYCLTSLKWLSNKLAVQKKNPFKKYRSIAFKIGTAIDIDIFLAKRSRTDLILGLIYSRPKVKSGIPLSLMIFTFFSWQNSWKFWPLDPSKLPKRTFINDVDFRVGRVGDFLISHSPHVFDFFRW